MFIDGHLGIKKGPRLECGNEAMGVMLIFLPPQSKKGKYKWNYWLNEALEFLCKPTMDKMKIYPQILSNKVIPLNLFFEKTMFMYSESRFKRIDTYIICLYMRIYVYIYYIHVTYIYVVYVTH